MLPDSVERVRTRGLISINFITARSCLQFILGIVAPAEVVSKRIFVTCLCRALFSYGDSFVLDLLLIGLVNMFCGSRAEVVSRQFCFLTLSSVFFSVGIQAGGFEFGCVGFVFLLVQVRYLGKYYSYVGHHISPSLSIGAQARLM